MQRAVKPFAEVKENRASEFRGVHGSENTVSEFNDSGSGRVIRSKARLEGVEKVVSGEMRLKLEINMGFENFAENARDRDRTEFFKLVSETFFRNRDNFSCFENKRKGTRVNAGVEQRRKVYTKWSGIREKF